MSSDSNTLSNTLSNVTRSVNKAINWLLYTREEIHLRERDQRMRSLFNRQGPLTSQDILEADFGTSNPNGLDIDHYPDFKNRFKNLRDEDNFKDMSEGERNRELDTVGGRAGLDENIYINPHYNDSRVQRRQARQLSNIISHEHIHRLQGDERDLGGQSAFSNGNMMFLNFPVMEAGLKGKVKNLYQSFRRAAVDGKALLENNFSFKVSDYYSKEVEVQARMHEALVQGYAGWQRMPATKQELWAAFHNMGLKTPPSIMDELRSNEEGQQALKDFRASSILRHTVRHNIRDINYLNDYAVFDDNKKFLWQQALPAIYGNLLELYGDGPGRARMGMGPNPVAAKNILRALHDHPEMLSESKIDALSEKVLPFRANELLLSISTKFPAGHPYHNKAYAFIDSLFARDDVRKALISQDEMRISGSSQGIPAWWSALNHGDTELLGKYREAGLNVAQGITICTHDNKKLRHLNILEKARELSVLKAQLAGTEEISKDLREFFNDADEKQRFLEIAKKEEISLRFIVDHCDDPDKKRHFNNGYNTEEKSMHDVMEEAGLSVHDKMPLPAEDRHISESSHL